jgi:hypothetical protein
MHLFSYFFASTQRNPISRVHSFQEIHVSDDFTERMDQLNDTYIKPYALVQEYTLQGETVEPDLHVEPALQSDQKEPALHVEPALQSDQKEPSLHVESVESDLQLDRKEPALKGDPVISVEFEESILREMDFDFEIQPVVMSHFDFDLNQSLMKWVDELLGEKK